MEIWKDIKGYEGLYQVSNLGRVKSYHKFTNGVILKPKKNRYGYYFVGLCSDTKRNHYIHRLVANTFILNMDNKPQVNHINGVKTDNRVENLEWCTNSENQSHAYKNNLKTSMKGGNHIMSKLNEDQVINILNDGRPNKEIAKEYNVGRLAISRIKSGASWKHINRNR